MDDREYVRRHDETFVYSDCDTDGHDERDAVDRMMNTDDTIWFLSSGNEAKSNGYRH